MVEALEVCGVVHIWLVSHMRSVAYLPLSLNLNDFYHRAQSQTSAYFILCLGFFSLQRN